MGCQGSPCVLACLRSARIRTRRLPDVYIHPSIHRNLLISHVCWTAKASGGEMIKKRRSMAWSLLSAAPRVLRPSLVSVRHTIEAALRASVAVVSSFDHFQKISWKGGLKNTFRSQLRHNDQHLKSRSSQRPCLAQGQATWAGRIVAMMAPRATVIASLLGCPNGGRHQCSC